MGQIPGHELSGPSRSDPLISLHQPQGTSSRRRLLKAHMWVWSPHCVPSSICVHAPPSRSPPPYLDCPGHPGVTPCLSDPHSMVSTEPPDWLPWSLLDPPVPSTELGCGHARGRLDVGHELEAGAVRIRVLGVREVALSHRGRWDQLWHFAEPARFGRLESS